MEHRTESNFSNSSMNDQLGASTTSSRSYLSKYIRGRRNRRELKRRMQVLDPFRYLQLPVQNSISSMFDCFKP
ncbi:8267_t:CDS:2 [Rhizophagus irregularis]|nr:8267_t:CDS:2 [Rhizophagus irregularis]